MFWCKDATAESAGGSLLTHFGRFGSPNMIRSDRGSHFANDLIKEFLDLTGTPHYLTLAYSSQENAIVERVNKEINRHLKGLCSIHHLLSIMQNAFRSYKELLIVHLINVRVQVQHLSYSRINLI